MKDNQVKETNETLPRRMRNREKKTDARRQKITFDSTFKFWRYT